MKNNKETEKEVAAAINEFLDGIEGIFKPRPALHDYQEKMLSQVFKDFLRTHLGKSARHAAAAETGFARMAEAFEVPPEILKMRFRPLPTSHLDPAINFADFEKKMVADIADCFEIPEELLKRPIHPGVSGARAGQRLRRAIAMRPAFFRANKGDKVFDVRRGWGKIVALLDPLRTGRILHIAVNFPPDTIRHYYRPDGRIKPGDVNPSLYRDEVDIYAPAQPAAKPEQRPVTRCRVRFKRDHETPCIESVGYYKSAGDFMKQQPAVLVLCACIIEESAKESPA